MTSTRNAVILSLLFGFLGFAMGYSLGENNRPLNITGEVTHQMFHPDQLNIYFDGDMVLSGKLDNNGSGNFVGEYKGQPVSAICSTNNNTACILDFKGKKQTITFSKKVDG